MTISNVNQMIGATRRFAFTRKAGVSNGPFAGRHYSHWGIAGIPGPGSTFADASSGTILTSTAGLVQGQLPFYSAPTGMKQYVSSFMTASQADSRIYLCDRIWQVGPFGSTSTALNSVVSPTWPARDVNGQSSGLGIFVGIEIAALTGTPATTACWQIDYTNSDGTTGRSGQTLTGVSTASAQGIGCFYPLQMQGTDKGVKAVSGITLLNAITGTGSYGLVAYRIILHRGSYTSACDMDGAPKNGMPVCYDGTVPFIIRQVRTGAEAYNHAAVQFVCG